MRRRLGKLAAKALSALLNPSHSDSRDDRPWEHPFLTAENLGRFRSFSQQVWEFALRHRSSKQGSLRCAFVVNMAQSMYIWARLARKRGVAADLFLHPLDSSALSRPEWEDFDGEYQEVLDGPGFLATHPELRPEVPCRVVDMDGAPFYSAYKRALAGDRRPFLRLLGESPGVRPEPLLEYQGFFPYYPWARELAGYDVCYAASSPFAAYASGRPYCAFAVGGDLQIDCGRGDSYGAAMSVAFNAARFLILSNPHGTGHCRRLGLTNGLYLPYVMDTTRYCPGRGAARAVWEGRFGPGVYVLSTARLDRRVKGQDEPFLRMLASLARQHPELRFVFLNWGESAEDVRTAINALGMSDRLILLPPVGKRRLLDYYRSCDLVLDQFVYGYQGATALEAAAVGKPVVMKWRTGHYAPLYGGDLPPIVNVDQREAVADVLPALVESRELRLRLGCEMREWIERNHGEERTLPILLALLALAADNVPLPRDLQNPLRDQETEAEGAYHRSRLVPRRTRDRGAPRR